MLRLARGRPLRFSGLLSPTGLLADLALASLGVVLAHFWLSEPYLLPLAIAPLFLIQRSFGLLARLGESEERFRTMFEGAPVGTVILDLERRIVSTNRVFEELVAYDKDELVGRRLADVSPEPEAASLEQLFGGAHAAYAGQRTLVRKDGAEVRGHVAASLVVDAQRRPQFVIVMVEDLTERLAPGGAAPPGAEDGGGGAARRRRRARLQQPADDHRRRTRFAACASSPAHDDAAARRSRRDRGRDRARRGAHAPAPRVQPAAGAAAARGRPQRRRRATRTGCSGA